jgi:hypothetical protein
MLVYWLSMFRALVRPSSEVQYWVPLNHYTATHYTSGLNLTTHIFSRFRHQKAVLTIVLLKMGILVPETCRVNEPAFVASSWSLSYIILQDIWWPGRNASTSPPKWKSAVLPSEPPYLLKWVLVFIKPTGLLKRGVCGNIQRWMFSVR